MDSRRTADPAQPKDSLTPEEAALHDALAKNLSAVDLIGKQELPVIAVQSVQTVQTVRRNSKVDWWRREDVRSRMPVAVKKILRRHGVPRTSRPTPSRS